MFIWRIWDLTSLARIVIWACYNKNKILIQGDKKLCIKNITAKQAIMLLTIEITYITTSIFQELYFLLKWFFVLKCFFFWKKSLFASQKLLWFWKSKSFFEWLHLLLWNLYLLLSIFFQSSCKLLFIFLPPCHRKKIKRSLKEDWTGIRVLTRPRFNRAFELLS